MKLKDILNEGTWSSPQTENQARELQKLMRKPIPANKADDVLYNLVGDDDLFDSIIEIEDEDPKEDVRQIVAGKLAEWLSGNLDDWKNQWDPKALKILKTIVDQYK